MERRYENYAVQVPENQADHEMQQQGRGPRTGPRSKAPLSRELELSFVGLILWLKKDKTIVSIG